MSDVEQDFALALQNLRAHQGDPNRRSEAREWALRWTYDGMAGKIVELLNAE